MLDIVSKGIKYIFECDILNKLSLNLDEKEKENKNFKKIPTKQKHSV